MTTRVYCLTLKDSERHFFQGAVLNTLDVEHEFVFGREFTDEDVAAIIKNPDDRCWKMSCFSNQRDYMKHALSCASGHLDCINAFLAGGADLGIVIEDDCMLPTDIGAKAELVASTLKGPHVWHLATEAINRYMGSKAPLERTPRLHKGRWRSAAAYMFDRKGAEALAKRLEGIPAPADIALFSGNLMVGVVYGTGVEMSAPFQRNSMIGRS